MKNYEKPVVIKTEELTEGVYLASGDAVAGGGATDGGATDVNGTCDSKYLQGAWNRPWTNKQPESNLNTLGCQGCPGDDGNGCKLLKGETKIADKTYQPTWEREGYPPEGSPYGHNN